MLVVLRRCTLGGWEEYKMLGCSSTRHCTRRIRMEPYSLVRRRLLMEKRSHYWCWEILPTLFFLGSWKHFQTTVVCPANKKTFNYRLSRAQVVVEHAYGRLKGWWRTAEKKNTSIHDLPKLVAACCVLHNICEIHRGNFNKVSLTMLQGAHQELQ